MKADRDKDWFQTIPPYGEYPGKEPGTVIVVDERAVNAVVADFNARRQADPAWPGLLVDREHFSLDPSKPSDAMAWAGGIRAAPDGSVWTRWEFTPAGREAFATRTLLYRSPVLRLEDLGGGRLRPVELLGIAMTNAPHFACLSPEAAFRAGESPLKAPFSIANFKSATVADLPQEDKPAETAEPERKTMDKIIQLLGLDPGSDEDAVLSAVQNLLDRLADAEQSQLNARADAFIERNRSIISDEEAFRAAYLRCPDEAEQLLAATRARAPEGRQLTPPAPARRAPETRETLKARMAALPCGKRGEFLAAHRAEIEAGGQNP